MCTQMHTQPNTHARNYKPVVCAVPALSVTRNMASDEYTHAHMHTYAHTQTHTYTDTHVNKSLSCVLYLR
jgi:hypothetical protein